VEICKAALKLRFITVLLKLVYVTFVPNHEKCFCQFYVAKQKTQVMKKNIGTVDKIIRILIAVIVAVLYFLHIINGTLAIVLLALAGIFILTSFAGFCPLYFPFGISTRPKDE
jgi:hypothetical protein